MKLAISFLWFFVLSSPFGVSVDAAGYHLTDPAAAVRAIERLAAKYGAENVLVAIDFDNVIAETETGLGSEAWFNWLNEEVRFYGKPSPLVHDYESLLALQKLILERRPMRLVDERMPKIVRMIQALGCRAILVTSRNPALYEVTLRNLTAFGIDFSRSALPGTDGPGFGGDYSPYDYRKLGASGLDTLTAWRLGLAVRPRAVRYDAGLYLTHGQHKGAMLRALLKKTGARPGAIFFVDDSLRHVEGIDDAFERTGIEIQACHYDRGAAGKRWFTPVEKARLGAELEALTPELAPLMPPRDCRTLLARWLTP